MQADEALPNVTAANATSGRAAGHAPTSRSASPLIAEQVVEDLRTAAGSLLTEQRGRAADTVHGIAEALHRTAETLHREQMPLAPYADRVADQIDAFSARIREQRWSDLLADAEAVAHRQPALFLVGAVAAGFIAGRFMTASERSADDMASDASATGVTSGPMDTR
jgi:hypothetical protein